MRRVLVLLFALTVGVTAPASPAFAHAGDAPLSTAYRVTVSGISAPEKGLSIRTVEAGARLELSNSTGHSVEVLGYSGEPYLDVRPDGIYQNVNSPAAYLNQTLTGDGPVPATADPTAPPSWRRVSTATTVRWHDQRTHWLSPGLPPAAAADPSRSHLLRTWQVPLRVGTHAFAVIGDLTWEPKPHLWRWWLGAAVLAFLLVTVRRYVRVIALIGGLSPLTYAVTAALDGSAPPLVPIVAGLIAIGAAYRNPPFFQMLAGTVLVIFAGFPLSRDFSNAVLATAGPEWLARALALVTLAFGAALAADGVRRLYAAAPAGAEPVAISSSA